MTAERPEPDLLAYANLKLAALGQPTLPTHGAAALAELAEPLLRTHREQEAVLGPRLCPADARIQAFLEEHLSDVGLPGVPQLPARTLTLDYPGLARVLSLPPDQPRFASDIVTTYRVQQGILHNPKHDRRTTQGVFHVAEGGLPIADDKCAVPKPVFAALLAAAMNPPPALCRLPLTATQAHPAEVFVSLLLRPVVCPAVPGLTAQRTLETRFFVPGSLVGNLDFIEQIFGNGGDPYLPEHDAALDPAHWTGHTGCVLLAPHLTAWRKKDLGLPAYDAATARQRRDGMCWRDPEERYNNGGAFKVTARTAAGVIVTVIADNYFGYCKKEIKTQISFSANLFGLAEEEHAGGALAFPSYDLGEEFAGKDVPGQPAATFAQLAERYAALMTVQPEGYGVDRRYPRILYVPEEAAFSIPQQRITWQHQGQPQQLKLLAGHWYVLPSGYKVYLKKQTGGSYWHLIGVTPEGAFCHKPCTVSGGGKSEISKPIVDAMIQGPLFVADFAQDMDQVAAILARDYSDRFQVPPVRSQPSRPILSPQRSLGSVIKLLTPAAEYTEAYNAWLQALPRHILEIVFTVKRLYQPAWGADWRAHFSVDVVNGYPGHELKCGRRKLVANYLRVGRETDGAWRIFKVRQDFAAAEKVQMEDDISATVVVPARLLPHLRAHTPYPSVKLTHNCEQMLFQRPDDAIYRGYDKQAEADVAASGVFLSNFEPLDLAQARALLEDAVNFDLYTPPMQRRLREFVQAGQEGFVVSSAHPRLVDGKPSKNPRYLQPRPDLAHPQRRYLAELGMRLARSIPWGADVPLPVDAVLLGRRMNPPDRATGVPALAVYNPLHYQELPELFMDLITSVTGKSPSTTGFGSEGALTKGPFNALWLIIDLNNALVDYILTGYAGFSSAAGCLGPRYRVDHDVSLLIPEIWSRMRTAERDPQYLLARGYLEKVEDFEHAGRRVPASILGCRITRKFVLAFLGRIFSSPHVVFTEEMLRPELQDRAVFAEGLENLMATYQRVAQQYFTDGSVDAACPPLRALLHVMAHGHDEEGRDRTHPALRALFTREALLASAWYRQRLQAAQARHVALAEAQVRALRAHGPGARLAQAQAHLAHVAAPAYVAQLEGTIGAEPCLQPAAAEAAALRGAR